MAIAPTIERFGPGEGITYPQPGDFILTHEDNDIFARLIHVGQGLRFRGADRPYARWNHAAIITDSLGTIIEALSSGVVFNHIDKYVPREYLVVHIDATPADRMEAVDFAVSCLHDRYGWQTIISIALSLLTGSKFSFGYDGQEICSGLVARSLERTAAIFPRDASHLMPADLARYYHVRI